MQLFHMLSCKSEGAYGYRKRNICDWVVVHTLEPIFDTNAFGDTGVKQKVAVNDEGCVRANTIYWL